jgi:ABC-type nitrate/sulfonate/bicarbonate transport system permease component
MIALALILVLLGGWELAVRIGNIDPLVLPPPSTVASSAWDNRALLWSAFEQTAKLVLIGLVIALVAGVAIACLLRLVPALRRGVEPLLVGSQAIPVPVLAPLLVVWFGFGLAPQLVVVTLFAFFPIAVATRDALGQLDPEAELVLRSIGAGRWPRLRLAELPGAVPGIITGLRVAVVFAVSGAVFADLIGGSSTSAADPTSSGGLGYLVQSSANQLDTALGLAATAVLAGFALLLFWSLGLLERATDHTTSTRGPR